MKASGKACREYFIPVSYTHLDTLERTAPAGRAVVNLIQPAEVKATVVTGLERLRPVSYTHLDVYKRQIVHRSQARVV